MSEKNKPKFDPIIISCNIIMFSFAFLGVFWVITGDNLLASFYIFSEDSLHEMRENDVNSDL